MTDHVLTTPDLSKESLAAIREFERATLFGSFNNRIYVLGFSNGVVKVGKTACPLHQRVKTILSTKRNLGQHETVTQAAVSISHINVIENERILLQSSGFERLHGEYLHVGFSAVEMAMRALNFRMQYTDEEKASQKRFCAMFDALTGKAPLNLVFVTGAVKVRKTRVN